MWFQAMMKFNFFSKRDDEFHPTKLESENEADLQEVAGHTDGSVITRKKLLTSACRKLEPVVLVHGGAGAIPDCMVGDKLNCVKKAALAGYSKLRAGGSSADAVEAAIRVMEDDPIMNAGAGSVLNYDGDVETDACIMIGQTLDAGGVSAVKDIANPISLAKMVMEKSPHTLLVGDGARRYAKENGFPLAEPGSLVTLGAKEALEYYKEHPDEEMSLENWTPKDQTETCHYVSNLETVGAVVVDRNGRMAVGTSTGGIVGKLPGRVGDSSQIGKGAYCDDDVGGASVTGHGESITKYCLTARILKEVEKGKNAAEATEIAINDLTDILHKDVGAICLTRNGDIGLFFNTPHMSWAYVKGKNLHYGMKPGEDMIEDAKY